MADLIGKLKIILLTWLFLKEQEFIKQNLIKKAMKEIDKKVDLSNQLEEKAKEKLKEEEKSSSENKEG